MKRSTPLKRKALLRKTRLRQVGARKKKETRELDRFRVSVAARGHCQAWCSRMFLATGITPWRPVSTKEMHAHHILPRSRGGTHDPENGLWVCASCHRWIHEHPKQAREMGWTR